MGSLSAVNDLIGLNKALFYVVYTIILARALK